MANITLSLSAKVDRYTGLSEVLVRLTSGKSFALRGKSGIFVPPEAWDATTQRLTTSRKMNASEVHEIVMLQQRLDNLCASIGNTFAQEQPTAPTSAWLASQIDKFHHPDRYNFNNLLLNEAIEEYISTIDPTAKRIAHFYVLSRLIARYQAYKGVQYRLSEVTERTLLDVERFIRDEHLLATQPTYRRVMSVAPETRAIKERGQNTVGAIMRQLRAVFHWAENCNMVQSSPFRKYKMPTEVYGTPIYMTIEERKSVEEFDFSQRPQLGIQRDIFIFQCLVGCRVGDLLAMTRDNVIDGAVEYIPHKTKGERAKIVRVPLTPTAAAILERYADPKCKELLPFISPQRYNDAIKEVLRIAGLTRMVTRINPTTLQEEKRPLYEVASSHMARRTFVGNLYKQVKDPALVGALSGHAEGSRAFARYRDIDEELRRETVSLLE